MAILGHHGRRDQPPCSVSRPCGSQSRNWRPSPLVRPSHSPSSECVLSRPASAPSAPVQSFAQRPRAGDSRRFVEPPTGKPCTAGPLGARGPSSKSRATNGCQALLRLREPATLSGAGPSLPRQRLQRPRIAPPRRLTATTAAWPADAVGPVRNARDYSHLPLPLSRTRSCRPTSATWLSGVGQLVGPISQAPRIPPILEIDVARAHAHVSSRFAEFLDRLARVVRGPGIVTAPPPDRLIPKSVAGDLDTSGVGALGQVYRSTRPSLSSSARTGAAAAWTCGSGAPDRRPGADGAAAGAVYEALVKRSQGQRLWHADETRWLVFVMLEGKVGYRWYLSGFHSREVDDLRPGGRAVARRA